MAAARFIVHGKVQGVWFRASTRDVAVRLGLTGQAMGDAEAIATLADWLQQGPPLARVYAVLRSDAEAVAMHDFEIG